MFSLQRRQKVGFMAHLFRKSDVIAVVVSLRQSPISHLKSHAARAGVTVQAMVDFADYGAGGQSAANLGEAVALTFEAERIALKNGCRPIASPREAQARWLEGLASQVRRGATDIEVVTEFFDTRGVGRIAVFGAMPSLGLLGG